MTDVNVVAQNPTAVPVLRFRDAYQRIIDEINKVPASELIPINIDIPAAVATSLGAMPEIMARFAKGRHCRAQTAQPRQRAGTQQCGRTPGTGATRLHRGQPSLALAHVRVPGWDQGR